MEIWKQVVGFGDSFEVSDLGRVRSIDRVAHTMTGVRSYRGRVLKTARSPRMAYVIVSLTYGGEQKTVAVHKLVLDAFVGPPPGGLVARHLDGDTSNNALDNLQWGTASQNMLDKRSHGTDHNASKTECPRGHRLQDPNLIMALRRQGRRSCLACNRAKAVIQYRSDLTLQVFSDQKYADIMAGEAVSHG